MKSIPSSMLHFCALAGLVLLLAACSAFSPSQDNALRVVTTPQSVTATTQAHTLEIFSPWDGGSDLDALRALEHLHQEHYPEVDLVARITGNTGGGTGEYLLERLRQQQPPDTFVIHAGKELLDYVHRGELEPITKLFKQEGLDRVLPPLLVEQITIQGEIYTVPVNIHRSNVLWYNPGVFQANHLNPPRTLDEFFDVAQTLKTKGITPLAIGGGFELGHLFESVLLATYGPADYVRLVNGDAAMWSDARLMTAIQLCKQMLQYANADRATQAFYQLSPSLLEGKAGMMIMGDWANGFFKGQGGKSGVDFAWAAAPGTDGSFLWLSDSFGLPKGAPHREGALEFLQTVGSKAGQDAFNPIKGSIPARIDADPSLYDAYSQWSINEFRTNRLAPSIMHGAAAPDSFRSAFSRALIDFSRDFDEQRLAEALRDAAAQLIQ